MADKRLSFRFRFPWRNNPRPTEEPNSRPPFRPAGKAPVKASPSLQAQPPQKTHNIPVSTSPAATESPKNPPPSHLSPSKKSQPTTASSQSQQVQEVAISQPSKPLRKIEVISENDSNAEDSTPRETISQTLETSPKAIDIFFSSDKSDSDTLGGDRNELSESETESKEHKPPEKVVQALTVEEKDKVPGPVKLLQERVIQLHAAATDSGNQTKDPLGVALEAENPHKKQESFGRMEILVSTSSDEKPIKNVSASESRISIQKMISSYSSTGEQAPPNKEIRHDVSKVDKLATGKEMLEKPADVVTLAGENNGANMHLSSKPAKREETLPIRRNYKLSSNYSTEATTDGDVSRKEEISNDHMSTEDQQSKGVYINSNVQSINNSVVFNTSVTERNPGVSMFSKSYDKPEPLQTHKAEILQTPADKYTHQSTVRRRCLRGLFMESSDSEPDNPAKPRRHGCRYVCGKDRKETDIGIV